MSFVVVQFLTGLANASALFLVASGLTVIFGVSRIVNFAHGSFYMLGAYVAWTLIDRLGGGVFGFWAGVVGAAVAVGLLGIVIERTLIRRLYGAPELMHLVATFGVLLVVQDLTLWIWGPEDLLGPRPPALAGAVTVLGERLPAWDLVLIALGLLTLGGLYLLLHRTRWGILVRAATEDREMTAALGVDRRWLFASVFFLGAFLAGLGGAVQLPREPANLAMDFGIIADVFVVVVIGGMGSVVGAFLAALLIAELQAFGILVFPEITLVLMFLAMAVVLIARPQGLLGRPEDEEHAAAQPLPTAALRWLTPAAIALAVALAALPAVADDYTLRVASEIFVFAAFAAGLQFLMGVGGMISFGHAAYLGLGAYGAALLVEHSEAPMWLALTAAPLVAATGGLIIGWFCVRRSGVYLAMLTLAFAQILWSAAFQWYEFTGGDNGITGVWPAEWARDPVVFYFLALVLCAVSVVVVRRVTVAPFGVSLRAGRDAPQRAAALGIDVRRVRWAAFGLAGAAAGMGGGVYAFLKGSVSPEVLEIPVSVDGLVMLLLGGLQTIIGPVIGAAAFTGLEVELRSATDLWRAVLGLLIIAIVLRFPNGVAETLLARQRRPSRARRQPA